MTYIGDSGSSDDMELLSDWFGNGEAVDFIIVETGSGILLMVPRVSTQYVELIRGYLAGSSRELGMSCF